MQPSTRTRTTALGGITTLAILLATPVNAATFAVATADARGSCATAAECQVVAGTTPPPPDRNESSTPGATATASRTSGNADASATAQAGMGWLRVGANAAGGGVVFRNTAEEFRSGGSAQASWTDSLLPTAAGVTGAFFTFQLRVDGTLAATRASDATQAFSNLTVSLRSPATFVPPSQGGQNNLASLQLGLVDRSAVIAGPGTPAGVTLTRTTSESLANGIPTVTTTTTPSANTVQIDEVLNITQWFAFGVSTTFEVLLQTGAGGQIGRPPGFPPQDGIGFYTGAGDFRSTLEWAGITAIRDAQGRDIRDRVSLVSGSGVDYRNAIVAPPVPLPASAWLLATGAALVVARARRRAKTP
jgi:hypothetical protein